MDELISYRNTDNIIRDVGRIIEDSQRTAYQSVNIILVLRNWLIGKRITEEELKGTDRTIIIVVTLRKTFAGI